MRDSAVQSTNAFGPGSGCRVAHGIDGRPRAGINTRCIEGQSWPVEWEMNNLPSRPGDLCTLRDPDTDLSFCHRHFDVAILPSCQWSHMHIQSEPRDIARPRILHA